MEEDETELWDSAVRSLAGSSCWRVTLTSVVLMAAKVSLKRLPDPDPDPDVVPPAVPGVEGFLERDW